MANFSMENMLGQVSPQNQVLQNQLEGLLKSFEQLNRAKEQTVPSTPSLQSVQFVKGIEGARKYLNNMPKNSSSAVFDSDVSQFYLLSVDANGIAAPIKIGKFELEDLPEEKPDTLTKKDLDNFEATIMNKLQAFIDSQQNSYGQKTSYNNNSNNNNKNQSGRDN